MKRWFTPLLIALTIITASCDIDPLTDAVDDFNIAIELEDINTGFSIGVYDAETKAIIEKKVTITFDSASAANTIDIFSTPIERKEFSTGFFSAGIRNDVVPTETDPLEVSFTLSADGYLDLATSVVLSDTGGISFNLDMISENNLPAGYSIDAFSAPLDSAGNAMPIPSPIDTTTGEVVGSSARSKIMAETQNVLLPKIIATEGVDISKIKWTLEDGSEFYGYPYGYQFGTYTWNPKTPEFNMGLSAACTDCQYPIRNIADLYSLKLKGPTSTNFSAIKSISYEGTPGDHYLRFELLVYAPDREDYWHTNVRKQVRDYFNYRIGLYKLYPTRVPRDSIETTKSFAKWWKATSFEKSPVEHYTGMQVPTFFMDNINDPIAGKFYLLQQQIHLKTSSAVYSHPRNGPSPQSLEVLAAYVNKIDNLLVRVEGYTKDDIGARGVSVTVDGYTINALENPEAGTYQFHNSISMSPAILSVELPHTTYSVYYDLSDYNGETIVLTPPSKPTNLVNATVTANLQCESPATKELNLSGFPLVNVAVRYRKVGDTGYPRVGSIEKLNYNNSTQVLESAVVNFPGVEVGAEYEFILAVDAFSEKTYETIDSENFDITLTVRDSYCQ